MFVRETVENFFNRESSVAHAVRVLSPYSVELQPIGFAPTDAAYQVLIQRAAFVMKANILPDRLAIGLRSAVVAGARNNPIAIPQLSEQIRTLGWLDTIAISEDEFRLSAQVAVSDFDGEEALLESCLRVAAVLSDFVLGQLLLVGEAGEMRIATRRAIDETSDDSPPWEYDPAERDRATRAHRALENWLIDELAAADLAALDPSGEPLFDLAWKTQAGLMVCEVKSSSNNEDKQLRLGLGQVLHYKRQLQNLGHARVTACLLVEREPGDPVWMQLCTELNVVLFWPGLWPPVPDRLSGRE